MRDDRDQEGGLNLLEWVRPLLTMAAGFGFLFLMMDVETYTKVAFHVILIPSLAYPLIYRRSPWRNGATGKALMNMARAVACLVFLRATSSTSPFPGGTTSTLLPSPTWVSRSRTSSRSCCS